MAQRKQRAWNPRSETVARRTGWPTELILRLSRKAEAELNTLMTLAGSGTVREDAPHTRELLDAGLITILREDAYGYPVATVTRRSHFRQVRSHSGGPNVRVEGPKGFFAEYPFDVGNRWDEFVAADYGRFVASKR